MVTDPATLIGYDDTPEVWPHEDRARYRHRSFAQKRVHAQGDLDQARDLVRRGTDLAVQNPRAASACAELATAMARIAATELLDLDQTVPSGPVDGDGGLR